jgi:membrane protein YdbS with pleckstrin-like domain
VVLAIIALAVSVCSAGFTGWGLTYARRSARSADRSADAAAITTGLEVDRRHTELTPRFRIQVIDTEPGLPLDRRYGWDLKMTIQLMGPYELERLDRLTVSIRDADEDQVRELKKSEFHAVTWRGPWRPWYLSVTGYGPEEVLTLPVGETVRFTLKLDRGPAELSAHNSLAWAHLLGNKLRLQLACVRDGYQPWVLATEHVIGESGAAWDVP